MANWGERILVAREAREAGQTLRAQACTCRERERQTGSAHVCCIRCCLEHQAALRLAWSLRMPSRG